MQNKWFSYLKQYKNNRRCDWQRNGIEGNVYMQRGYYNNTKIQDFSRLFGGKLVLPCRNIGQKQISNYLQLHQQSRRLFIVQEKIPCLRQKLINSIPCLRQKSRKTYPGWRHVPIKPLSGSTPPGSLVTPPLYLPCRHQLALRLKVPIT